MCVRTGSRTRGGPAGANRPRGCRSTRSAFHAEPLHILCADIEDHGGLRRAPWNRPPRMSFATPRCPELSACAPQTALCLTPARSFLSSARKAQMVGASGQLQGCQFFLSYRLDVTPLRGLSCSVRPGVSYGSIGNQWIPARVTRDIEVSNEHRQCCTTGGSTSNTPGTSAGDSRTTTIRRQPGPLQP